MIKIRYSEPIERNVSVRAWNMTPSNKILKLIKLGTSVKEAKNRILINNEMKGLCFMLPNIKGLVNQF